jgi:methyl-accepting chemotaxis protein
MNFRQTHNRRVSFFFLVALALHVPAFLVVGSLNDKPPLVTLLLSALFLSAPVILYVSGGTSALLPCVISFSSIAFSGLLIHLGGGMIEMHFHIFVMTAAFIAFGLVSPLLVGLGATAVHHLLFFFLLPSSVFNYQASFGIVVLHAGFVILETLPALYIATRLKKLIGSQDSTLGELGSINEKINASVTDLHSAGQTLEQINSMVQLSASHAQQVADLSRGSSEIAVKGEAEMTSLVDAMQGMARFSKKIEEITRVIDEIAFQTNLLALNAAVEAARAGDKGNGFAVVAEAVRELAQRSGSAAKDIASLIGQSHQLVGTGVGATQRSGEALKNIVASVKKVAQLNQEIASASREQASGIQNVMQSVSKLDEAARTNAKTSEHFASSADELGQQAMRMKGLIGDLQENVA